MGTYSRWALIRGWAIIRINTVIFFLTLNYLKFGFPVAFTYFLAHWSSGSYLLKKDNFLCAFYWLSQTLQRLWKKQGNKILNTTLPFNMADGSINKIMPHSNKHRCTVKPWGVLLGILGGGCHPILQILPLFQTKKCHFEFPHPFSDQTSKIHTRFQSWPF